MNNDLRQDLMRQMEEERERKHHKSYANASIIARHNPITNPIEVRIDNPYILSSIQNKEQGRY